MHRPGSAAQERKHENHRQKGQRRGRRARDARARARTAAQGEPAEARLLLFGPSLEHRLVEAHRVLVVVVPTVQSHAQDFRPAVHGAHPPHRHARPQSVEVSAGQQVGPEEGSRGEGDPAAALRVVEVPRRMLKVVQHFEDALFPVRLVEEEGDGQGGVA